MGANIFLIPFLHLDTDLDPGFSWIDTVPPCLVFGCDVSGFFVKKSWLLLVVLFLALLWHRTVSLSCFHVSCRRLYQITNPKTVSWVILFVNWNVRRPHNIMLQILKKWAFFFDFVGRFVCFAGHTWSHQRCPRNNSTVAFSREIFLAEFSIETFSLGPASSHSNPPESQLGTVTEKPSAEV